MRKPYYFYLLVIATVFFSCEKNTDSKSANSVGAGGSLAKFTVVGNYIYAVSAHYLYTVDISDPSKPANVGKSVLSFDMETIYPYKNSLFIGSRTGLYIYSIDNPAAPALVGEAKHGRSCDPVIANDSVSYSTLKGSTFCGPATSGLYVYDVKNLNQPELKKTIAINEPIGLAMADSALYVSCANEGLKVYSIKDAYNPVERQLISGHHFIDLIPYDDILICWVSDGIVLYDISDRLQPVFIKHIAK
jgi:hypothetical protein